MTHVAPTVDQWGCRLLPAANRRSEVGAGREPHALVGGHLHAQAFVLPAYSANLAFLDLAGLEGAKASEHHTISARQRFTNAVQDRVERCVT